LSGFVAGANAPVQTEDAFAVKTFASTPATGAGAENFRRSNAATGNESACNAAIATRR
jgi:hypothetical protein